MMEIVMKTISINSKNLARATFVWLAIFTVYEIVDSLMWMTQTSTMFLAHPALGKFSGYDAAMMGDGSLQRLPIIVGKWIGMAKFFLTGALLTVLIFGNNKARGFLFAWNFICLMIMSAALYPTLDHIAVQYPEDFSNGFSKMWTLETLVGVFSGIFCVVAIASEVLAQQEK